MAKIVVDNAEITILEINEKDYIYGLAEIKIDGKNGFIDQQGNVIFKEP